MPIEAPNLESLIANLKETKNSFVIDQDGYDYKKTFTVISGKQVRRCLQEAIGKRTRGIYDRMHPRDLIWKAEAKSNYVALSTGTRIGSYEIYRVGNNQFVVHAVYVSSTRIHTSDAANEFKPGRFRALFRRLFK